VSAYAIKPVKRSELLRLLCGAIQKGDTAPQPKSENEEKVRPANPLRILLAEDSEDNQFLVRVYLKGSPHLLTVADNGQAAVDLFSAATFDLILMDVQMPVMDGLTATRAIRAVERERKSVAIPIIALTANAGPQDTALSDSAGCSYHLSKPISRQALLNTIEEYGTVTESIQPIEIEIPVGLEELVPRYLEARRNDLPKMLKLLAASGFAPLSALAHDLKGTGTPYGFPALTRIGEALEQSAKCMDAAAVSGQLAELEDYLSRVHLAAKP
jgi:CheY-like chemotaxis protein